MALLHGILLALDLHLPRIIMESDALVAIQAINDKSIGGCSGHLIQEILHFPFAGMFVLMVFGE